MTNREPTPADVVLVAIDISKLRNDVLIELPGSVRRKRLTVLNTKMEHDRFVELLGGLGRSVIAGFEATGNYHRPHVIGPLRPQRGSCGHCRRARRAPARHSGARNW